MIVTWQQGSTNPENTNNFLTISQWWANLNGKEITWRQRLIPASGNVTQLDWEPQRFDENFLVSNPQVRGITLYWHKPDVAQERSTTPQKIELDTLKQHIYIYPHSQKEVVIRVGLPEIIYQTLDLKHPQFQLSSVGENRILTLRDTQHQVEVKVTLTPEEINQLKNQL